jgi:hypothetical protein
MADWMIRAAVPRVDASAHYCGENYLEYCYCIAPNWGMYKSCTWTCWPGDPQGSFCGLSCNVRIRGC